MSDTLLRQLTLLRNIPRAPKRIDAQTLRQHLEASGYRVDLRTVQRDLVSLSLVFPLISDDAKPRGWRWEADAAQLDLPTLEPLTALVFHLAEKHLNALLPAASLTQLAPWFANANRLLDCQDGGLAEQVKIVVA